MDCLVKIETRNGLTILIADSGKILFSDGIFSEKVFLGKYDDPKNWKEIESSAKDIISEFTME